MLRYYEALRRLRAQLLDNRHEINESLVITPTSSSSSVATMPPTSLSSLRRSSSPSVMKWFYLHEIVPLSLTSSIIRRMVRNYVGVTQQLYISPVTSKAASLLKWSRSLQMVYLDHHTSKSDPNGPLGHDYPYIKREVGQCDKLVVLLLSFRYLRVTMLLSMYR
jgi:hypothetical protein